MKAPLILIAELLFGILSSIVETILFIVDKLGELLISLLFFSTLGIFAFIVAVVIGVLVFFLITKFIFKSSSTLLTFGISFVVVIVVLILLSMI